MSRIKPKTAKKQTAIYSHLIRYASTIYTAQKNYHYSVIIRQKSGQIYPPPTQSIIYSIAKSWIKHIQSQLINKKQARWIKRFSFKTVTGFKPKKRPGRPRKAPAFIPQIWTQIKAFVKAFFYPCTFALTRYPKPTLAILFVTSAIFGLTYLGYTGIFKDLPSPTELTTRSQSVTTKIMDRNNQVLYRIYQDENRSLVSLDQISPFMISATIAIEDQDFYLHHGISVSGIVRAFSANLQTESLQGGSTITQQLVKNRLLSNEKTMTRKIKEALLSVMVELTFSKDEILEMYLNQVSYGGSTYGVEEAAQRYFGKSAQNLSLAESALLAGLPAAPSVYTPFGSNPELAKVRQKEVLRRMVEDGWISQNQSILATNDKLVFRQDMVDIQAPHFVMYIKKLLAEEFGEEALMNDGLEVITTLDLPLQKEAEQVIADEISRIQRLNVSNGASLVTNPETGEVLAMVGSSNYFDFKNDGQVNVTLRPRQPGSSIKPITYSLALEKGYTASTIIQDSPITYQIPGSPPYSPRNYDAKYHGNVTLREALASSYNIPAVKTLANLGVSNLIDHAQKLGITTWQDRSRFGLSLTLGGGEVTMMDMTSAYGVFATNGFKVPINPIIKVTNYQGKVLYENPCVINNFCQKERVLSAQTAYLITNILSDNQARTPAFGPISSLYIPGQEVAVKTGTTNSLRDNWTIGYTSDRLVGVWVGNNDNRPMSYVASGVTGASPIWNKTMRLLLDEDQPHHFIQPSGLVTIQICATTNTLPCGGCPKVKTEIYRIGTGPQSHCAPIVFHPTPTP
ncbi:MAG: PBP1A family penicillin-binding protein [Patescibacteria group bacterium]